MTCEIEGSDASRTNSTVTIFFDESGTHAGSPRILIGAIVVPDCDSLELILTDAAVRALAMDRFWVPRPEKRDKFATRGFHHCEDAVDLRTWFLDVLRPLDFRAHVVWSERALGLSDHELLLNMFYTLLRNLALRYRSQHIRLVFETESNFEKWYARIWAQVLEDLMTTRELAVSSEVLIGHKGDPGLSVVDYVLAYSDEALTPIKRSEHAIPEVPAYVARRIPEMQMQFAHAVDFDRVIHKSARKGIVFL